MENIYKTNKWMIIITLALYLTLWGGVLFQLILGLIQLISCGIYIENWSKIKPSLKPLLVLYCIITIPLIALLFIFPETFMMIIWIGSMFLAFYFLYITDQQNKFSNHEL